MDDSLDEPDETFGIKLGAVKGHVVDTSEVIVTILDEDTVPEILAISDVIQSLGYELTLSAQASGSDALLNGARTASPSQEQRAIISDSLR